MFKFIERINPFTLVALLVIGVFVYIFVTVFFESKYLTFTAEEQIQTQKEVSFGILSSYL